MAARLQPVDLLSTDFLANFRMRFDHHKRMAVLTLLRDGST